MLSIAPSRHVERREPQTLPSSFAASLVLHLGAAALVSFLTAAQALPPVAAEQQTNARSTERIDPVHIVFVAPASPVAQGRGGGGGGNRQTGPIRRAESPGHDAMTLRIARPLTEPQGIVADVPRLPALLLDAKPLASGFEEHIGLPVGGVTFGTSTGAGSGGGVGTGTGTGIGPGRGPGLGDGIGGGTGGGVYRVGRSVTAPQLVRHVRPSYTPLALERRVQGSVTLELIVTAAGAASQIRVVHALDPGGLDEEAIKAVSEWKFSPGRLSDTPVPVLVTVVVDFTIR